jgi:dTMP kinase
MSKLIVIEGVCDGVGKSTQLKLIKEKLNNVVTCHFPNYDSPSACLLKEFLKGNLGSTDEIPPIVSTSYYALDIEYTWRNMLKKEYDKGNLIILDRYATTNLIYQTLYVDSLDEKNKLIDSIEDLEYNTFNIKRPDQVIFLDGDFDIINKLRLERKDNEGIQNDVYERDSKLMKRVYDSAKYVSKYLDWDIVEVTSGDEMRSIDSINDDIMKLIRKK